MLDEHELPPPSSVDVEDRRPRVYDAYGVAYVRPVGFTPTVRAVQTTGTFPALTRKPASPRKPGKGGKGC